MDGMTTPATTPADEIEQSTIMGNLRRFLDVAAGEGYVFDGIDAADLYIAFFGDGVNPPTSGLTLATPSPGKAQEPAGGHSGDEAKKAWSAGTVHDANLYNEVLQKAIGMGYANVSAALEDAAKWKASALASPGKAEAERQRLRKAAENVIAAWDKASEEDWDECRYEAFSDSNTIEALRAAIQQERDKQ